MKREMLLEEERRISIAWALQYERQQGTFCSRCSVCVCVCVSAGDEDEEEEGRGTLT